MAADDTPPAGGPERRAGDAGQGSRRNMGLIFSLLVIAALLIVTALVMRSWRSTAARNDGAIHRSAPAGAPGGGGGPPAPGP